MDSFQEKAVAKCLDADDKLTEWEHEFLMSIAGRDGPLSDKQASVLNRILTKVEFGD